MILKPPSCQGCPLYGSGRGFVPADGTGLNGVLIVLEAAGADEAECGRPTVGKAGHYLWSQLARVNLEREDFKIHNVLSCQPRVPGYKDNFLAGAPYESQAISHCRPNLDATITDHVAATRLSGLTPVVVTLGRVAFKRVLGLDHKDSLLKEDYLCYPFWSNSYKTWVIAGDHPSFIMRGNHYLVPMLQFLVKRAVEIAAEGLELDKPYYHLDPTPQAFDGWVREYLRREDDPETFLSYDIETPHKKGRDESALAKEEQVSYKIDRVSFCYKPGDAVSVEWNEAYMEGIKSLFGSRGQKVGWNNNQYDDPRIKAQVPVQGDLLDAMLAWHVLNTALPKGLGFVTPFYWKNTLMWKHEAESKPSFYNAKDADAALRNWLGISKDLKNHNLWHVFDRHIVQVNRCFQFMSSQGVILDMALRAKNEVSITEALQTVEGEIEAAVPDEAREYKVFKKEPKDVTGMVQKYDFVAVPTCPNCHAQFVKATHFKSVGKKRLKSGEPENPCVGFKSSKIKTLVPLWARPLEFKISKTSLTRYQSVMKHRPIYEKDTRHLAEPKVTFDEKAIIKLQKIYKTDKLYPLILKQRGCQKLLSTYLGRTEAEPCPE